MYVRHAHALVNAEVFLRVVKVTWNVLHFVVAKLNVKTKVLCKYSRYITRFFW